MYYNARGTNFARILFCCNLNLSNFTIITTSLIVFIPLYTYIGIYDEFKGEYEQAWEYIHLFFALCAQIYITDICFILSKKGLSLKKIICDFVNFSFLDIWSAEGMVIHKIKILVGVMTIWVMKVRMICFPQPAGTV